jgi:quinol---cytochrome-c reductase cytochrome c subunit
MSRTVRRLAIGAALVSVLLSANATASAQGDDDQVQQGRELFLISCSSCHGIDAQGGYGPSLIGAGAANPDFMLTTGRMPLAAPGLQAVRKPPAFNDEEIARLVAYIASLGDGIPIPDVQPDRGDLTAGGDLFRQNCAACHSAAGAGGALPLGIRAPSLYEATPTQIGEAIRIGPGPMPDFSETVLSGRDVDSIAAYIGYLQDSGNPGGFSLGRRGPVTEGIVAWVVAVPLLLLTVMWIERFRVRRRL